MKKKVFLSFLMPYPIRSIVAPYLWIYYKQMSSFNNKEILFIGSKEYRSDPKLFGESRYEVNPDSAEYLGYNLPTLDTIESYQFYDFDNTIFTKLEQIHNYNTNQIFKHILTEPIEEIENHLNHLLTAILQKHQVTAVLSWCNFPSLNSIALKHNLRIIHNELGAFRKPYYQPTAYFDFSGVNGNTESKNRFKQFSNTLDKDLLLGLDEIKKIMFLGKDINKIETERFDIGVALQVEDDSNILAFSNGFDSISLLRWVSDNHPNKSFTIREHPAGYLKYNKFGHIDTSVNSIAFLLKCDSVITINSSVALEAMLFEKHINILGDNPFSFLMNIDENQKVMALNFAIFGYMIPYDYLFDFDYYTWRLSNPTENDIFEKHLNYYKTQRASFPLVTFDGIEYHSYIQLFIEDKNGISEENSIKLPVAQNIETQEFVFDFSDKQNIKTLRLDPLNEACVVEIEKLVLIKTDGTEINLCEGLTSNAIIHHSKSYFFDTIDPICYFTSMDFTDTQKLIAHIRYPHIGRDALEMSSRHTKLELDQTKGELDQTKGELDQTKGELDQTKGELEQTKNELVSLYTSRSYRMTRPLRGLARSLRKIFR